ncbi:MAG: winged helix-turn-helix transcriptional regulator, partial [Candidatus Aminicenantes bacterium]|nr:winged helix-turn-helix transcriptional regulator [Candidatus Aminicenantes bacterium]
MKETIKIFKALAEPTRLRAFLLLLERDLCVCELTFILEMSQSRVSHQLRILRDADLVEDSRLGRWMIYSIPAAVKKDLAPLLSRRARPDLARSRDLRRDLRRLAL